MKKYIVAALGAAALLVGGVAFAAIPGASGIISACYKSSGGGPPATQGVLRAIDAEGGATCLSGETALAWNQTGPQGPQGEQGPVGATGPQGPAGSNATAGIAGWQLILQNITVSQTETTNGVGFNITCPNGKALLSGGYEFLNSTFTSGDFTGGRGMSILSHPDGGSTSTFGSWQVALYADSAPAREVYLRIYALCANNA